MRQHLMKSNENVGERLDLLRKIVRGACELSEPLVEQIGSTTIRVRYDGAAKSAWLEQLDGGAATELAQRDGILVCVVCVPSGYQRICL